MCNSISTESTATAAPTLEVLYRSPSGSLSFCPGCRSFGITFGCLHLNLGSEAVLALGHVLERLSATELKPGQCHMVRLGSTPATLLLSPHELTGLQRIVRQGHRAALSARTTLDGSMPASGSEAWVH